MRRHIHVRKHTRRTAMGHTTVDAHNRTDASKVRFSVTPAHNPATQRGTALYVRDGRLTLTCVERAKDLAKRLSEEHPKIEYWIVPGRAAFTGVFTTDEIYHRYLNGHRLVDENGYSTPRTRFPG